MFTGIAQHVRATVDGRLSSVLSASHVPTHFTNFLCAGDSHSHIATLKAIPDLDCLVIKGWLTTLQCKRDPPYIQRNSSSSAAPGRWELDDPEFETRQKQDIILQIIQTGSGAHQVIPAVISPGVERRGYEVADSRLLAVRLLTVEQYTASMAWQGATSGLTFYFSAPLVKTIHSDRWN